MRKSKLSRGKRAEKHSQKSRHESENRYRALIESCLDAIYVVDRRSGKIVDINDAVCKLLGYSRGKIIGTIAGSRVVPSQKNAFRRKFAQFQKSGRFSGEVDLRRKDGSIILVEANGSAFGDYLFVVARDITERRRMEEELRSSREFMRNVLESSADAIITTNTDGVITSWSKGAERIYGYKAEDIIGQGIYDLYPASLREERAKWLRELLAGEKVKDVRTRIYRADGSLADITLSLALMRDGKGMPIGTVGVSKDITEHLKAEEALKESEARFRTVTEGALAGVYIIQDGKLRYVNPAVAQIFGYALDEMLDRSPIDFVHPDDRSLVAENIRRRLEGKAEAIHYTFRGLRKDGITIYCEVLGRRIEYRGRPAIIGTMLDITERKRAEEELAALLDISRNISTTIELDKLLDVAVQKIVKVTSADRVSVVLLDEQGKASVPAAYTKSGEKAGVGNVFDLADFRRMREAVEKKRTIYVPDALDPRTQSPLEIALAKKLNIGSGVHVPLMVRERVLGLLNLAAVGHARKFTRHEIEFYKAIANELAAMIANAELYEETKRARSEAEFYVDLLSHDINNANTIALGMLELLAENADLGDNLEFVQRSTAAIRRSVNLIDTVRKIQLAKSTGKVAFEKRNLDTILKEVIEDVKNFHSDKLVTVSYVPKEAMVFTDGLARDLFWNILDNAAKYDPHHDIEIDVEVTDGGSEWTTMISDRGKGIPDDFKTVIFERFRRLDTGVRGFGVGLYLCKLLTDKYGGRIWVEDRVKGDHMQGSTFCIALPKG